MFLQYLGYMQYQICTYVNEIFKDGILIRTRNHEIYENYGFTTNPPCYQGLVSIVLRFFSCMDKGSRLNVIKDFLS